LYISRAVSYFYDTEFEIEAGFLGRPAVLKFSAIFHKYIFMVKTSTKLEFLHIVASALKSEKKVNFGFKVYFFRSK
jgi:hypothetical protein